MEPKGFHRKLTAILSADVAGYSRLMQDDEFVTVKTLEAYKSVISDLVTQNRGRVVDSPGDNLLAEFASVVDAVQCAVATQKELQARNAELPENRRMQFRIGVNLGDVIEEETRIYGDGVNIAARLESLADPGGICVSKTAFDQIETKLPFGYEYLGEQAVKNIAKPVGAYRVILEPRVTEAKAARAKSARRSFLTFVSSGAIAVIAVAALWQFALHPTPPRPGAIEKADPQKMAYPLPNMPSIAVLPFVNLSGDPKNDNYSDGLTEQIITSLSMFPRLFVIARNSTLAYKGNAVKVQKVAEDLGVQYVLEGSVQRSGDKVRITAQLIDALSGRQVWSERYDCEAKDIFDLQDEITLKIGQAMKFELTEKEQEQSYAKWKTKSLIAFEKNYQGVGYARRATKQDNDMARRMYEEALSADPKYLLAKLNLAWTYFQDARMGWSESPVKPIEEAYKLAQEILTADDSNDPAYTLLAAIYLVKRQHDEAIEAAERAVAINPNGALAFLTLGGIVGCTGKWGDSVLYIKKAIRLNPFPQLVNFWFLGRALFMLGQYNESIATLKMALELHPDYLPAHIFLAANYSSMGRDSEADASAREILRINPKFTIESHARTIPYKHGPDIERELAALRNAGLK